ncbi:MAG: hypothetical protein PVF58_00255 [Candidatus Methanofastidiosia archaeon]|jgi:hypothetical protein
MFGKDRKDKIKQDILKILKKDGEGVAVPELCIPKADEGEIEDAFLELELEEKVELVGFKDFVREDGGLFSIGLYALKERKK